MRIDYPLSTVRPYINWDYFFYAWGVHQQTAAERQTLRAEADEWLTRLSSSYRTHAVFRLFRAHSEADDVVLDSDEQGRPLNRHIPFLRQQQMGSACLCLADFIHPQPSTAPFAAAVASVIGVFAATVDRGLETDFRHDPYEQMMVQLLADRLAEATAECMHEAVRRQYWGYAPDEQLSMQQLHTEQFQGIRPAVGYPSLPDTSLNFVIDQLLDMRQIGIRLTESGAMLPHGSVSGFMFAHRQARYFALGKIGEDQLRDYARRRGLPVETMRKYLSTHV